MATREQQSTAGLQTRAPSLQEQLRRSGSGSSTGLPGRKRYAANRRLPKAYRCIVCGTVRESASSRPPRVCPAVRDESGKVSRSPCHNAVIGKVDYSKTSDEARAKYRAAWIKRRLIQAKTTDRGTQ